MFVLLVYDVNGRRDGKVLKTCRKYLTHVQKSVFEGTISEGKLNKLMKELQRVIEPEEDHIMIYRFNSLKYTSKEEIGSFAVTDNIL